MDLKEYLQQNTADDKLSFGRFVRQRREELGLTVRGFAQDLGITAAYLSDIEKGNRYAPKAFLEKLRVGLRIPAEDMRDFEDLASATRGFQYEDINPYLGKQPLARVALRKARDLNISPEEWQAFIDRMDSSNQAGKS